jgi:hypothetical protein
MHDPVGLLAPGCSAAVEDERLLHAHQVKAWSVAQHIAVFAGGLPVACLGGSVRAHASGVLAVPQAEEIPLLLPNLGFLCDTTKPRNSFTSVPPRNMSIYNSSERLQTYNSGLPYFMP